MKLRTPGIIMILATLLAGYAGIVKREVDFCKGVEAEFCDNHNKPPSRAPYWK